MQPTRAHASDDVLAGDAAIDGTTEIDRVRHQQHIVGVHVAREALNERIAHQSQRAEAVRLEHDQQTAWEGVQRVERGGDLIGVVAEIVDDGDATRFADDFEAPFRAGKALERLSCLRKRQTVRAGGGYRGERVGDIVLAWHGKIDCRGGARVFLQHVERDAVGRQANGGAVQIGEAGAEREGADPNLRRHHKRRGFLVVEVQHGDLGLVDETGKQRAQFVHALMIEGDVVDDGDGRLVAGDRAIAFVDLRHECIALADKRAGEERVRRDEVVHHGAVHDRGVAPGVEQHPGDHGGRGGLAAGARDADAHRRPVEQFRQQLRALHVARANALGGDNIADGVFHRCRAHQDLVGAGQARTVLREEGDALRFQVLEFRAQAALVERAV